jgi:predicted TPR repeat methyltransferase
MDPKLEQARDWFFQGIEHFEAGRLEPARAAFQTSLTLAPGRPSVLGNLGITLFHLGRLEEAVPLLQQVTSADPDHGDAWTCLGLSHANLAQWQDAVDALSQASKLFPQNAELLVRKGQSLLRLGRAPEAMQAFDRAVAVDPSHANAWSARGNLLRELHQLDDAAACFEKALALGADPELTSYYLASVRGTATPPLPPRRYVESLFDDYAADFQSHVVGSLRYQGYELLLRPLADAKRRFHRALELGCGTGLCAPLISPLVDVLDGVDISQAMLEQAQKLGIYRKLIHADIGSYLEAAEGEVDLVLAADVFIYVGDLADVFRSVRKLLVPGGRFAFTVEAPANDEDLQLLPSLRYAHSERYVRRLAEATGFQVDEIFSAPIRYDQARPLEAMYVYLS